MVLQLEIVVDRNVPIFTILCSFSYSFHCCYLNILGTHPLFGADNNGRRWLVCLKHEYDNIRSSLQFLKESQGSRFEGTYILLIAVVCSLLRRIIYIFVSRYPRFVQHCALIFKEKNT